MRKVEGRGHFISATAKFTPIGLALRFLPKNIVMLSRTNISAQNTAQQKNQ